jgi:ethanolamine utilization protein EutQ (cupin superfamily)
VVTVSYRLGGVSPLRTKFVRNALSTPPVRVDSIGQSQQDAWSQVDLINPVNTNITVVSGIAHHPTRTLNEGTFYYHQLALCIEGEMVVQDLANGNVYYGREGDLYYWAPGHHQMLGGPFKAFFVKTPIPSRWVNTPNGKQGVPMFELVDETKLEASAPDETREVRPWSLGTKRGPRMKFIRGALQAKPIMVTDTAGTLDAWSQVDLVNASDSDFTVVAGIAQHPTDTEFEWEHRRHQVTLVLDGELVSEDADTGVTYRGHKGDVFYWPPGIKLRLSGKFKAYFVETPVTSRWTSIPQGKRKVDLVNLQDEFLYEASPPDEVRKERLTRV